MRQEGVRILLSRLAVASHRSQVLRYRPFVRLRRATCGVRRVIKNAIYGYLTVTFLLFVLPSSAAELKIHFLDVGEGDSILIETPQGKTVLIDAGNLITGFKVAQYLKNKNINRLDHFIFTHPDPDHIGGVFFVLQMAKAGKIYDNGEDIAGIAQAQDLYRWYVGLVRKNENYSVLKEGDTISLDGVTFKVIWPYRPFIFSDFNANSLVIMVEYKNFRCLLAGDLTIRGEKELLKKGKNLDADILKVGHHGSDDASSQEFLEAVTPKIAIISVNEDNLRGYPSVEVLEKLKRLGSQLYRTDRYGNIVVNISEEGEITVITER